MRRDGELVFGEGGGDSGVLDLDADGGVVL